MRCSPACGSYVGVTTDEDADNTGAGTVMPPPTIDVIRQRRQTMDEQETLFDFIEATLCGLDAEMSGSEALDLFLAVALHQPETNTDHWAYTKASPDQLRGKLAQFRNQMEGARFAQEMEDTVQTFRTSVMAQTPHQSGMQTASRPLQTRP